MLDLRKKVKHIFPWKKTNANFVFFSNKEKNFKYWIP